MKAETVKHTEGPWKPVKLNDGTYMIDAHGHVTVCHMNDLSDETEANARLIAACPTMFEYVQEKANGGDTDAQEILRNVQGSGQGRG